MSFRLPPREEELTPAKLAAVKRPSSTSKDFAPMSEERKLDGSSALDTSSAALSHDPRRRHIVFPDPVAFR